MRFLFVSLCQSPREGIVCRMKRRLLPLGPCLLAILLAGCLAVPVADSGGVGSVTVPNTNVTAIMSAAQSVFSQYGYSMGPVNYPVSISFDKPAGGFGQLLYGSYDVTTTIRVRLSMAPMPGSNDYQLKTQAFRVSDAGEAGFEDSRRMIGLWSAEFQPLLQKIKAITANAGPGA
jgi:hypothetical protein